MKKLLLISACVCMILSLTSCSAFAEGFKKGMEDAASQDASSSKGVVSIENSSITSQSNESSAQIESSKAVIPVKYEAKLSSGYYTSGIDFPAGEYDIKAISGGGNVSSSNMYDGGLNAVMGIAEKGDMYEQEYANIKLPENTVLFVSGVVIGITTDNAAAAPLTKREQPNTKEVSLGNGNFTAGKDFPAGVYDIVAVSGSGNVSSSNMYDGGLNAVMGTESGDLYEKQYKNLALSEGVELTISGVKIKLIPSK